MRKADLERVNLRLSQQIRFLEERQMTPHIVRLLVDSAAKAGADVFQETLQKPFRMPETKLLPLGPCPVCKRKEHQR